MSDKRAEAKILRVITRLNIGGPAIHAVLLSSELNKNGSYRDILVCGKVSESEGDMMYLAQSKGLKPIVIPELSREISLKKDIKAFFSLLRILREERPDIIHTHTAKAGTLGRLAAVFSRVPVKVHTFHGHIFDGYFSPVRAKFFLWIERFLALFTDRVITVSKRVEEEVIGELKVADKKKSVVVSLGLEFEKFVDCWKQKGEFRKSLGLDKDTALVGIVGRLVPIKNHKMFLDIAKMVKDKMPERKIRFIIVGDGESRSYLERYTVSLGLKEHVIFTGWVKELAPVYADLDIIALTSLNEGTPVSLIEAMAAGKPVISTDVGGVKDVLEDGLAGIVVKSMDIEAFSTRLMALLKDDEMRHKIGAAGKEAVIKKYSKERLVRDIKSLYAGLISKTKSA